MFTLIGSEFPGAYRCMAGIESDEEPCLTDCLSWTDISEGEPDKMVDDSCVCVDRNLQDMEAGSNINEDIKQLHKCVIVIAMTLCCLVNIDAFFGHVHWEQLLCLPKDVLCSESSIQLLVLQTGRIAFVMARLPASEAYSRLEEFSQPHGLVSPWGQPHMQ